MLPPRPPKEDDHHDDDSDLHRFIANVKVVRQHSSLFKLPQQSPVPSTLGAIEEPAEGAHEAASAASAEAAAESSSDTVLPLASSSLRVCPVVQPLRPSTRAFTRRIGFSRAADPPDSGLVCSAQAKPRSAPRALSTLQPRRVR